MATPNRPEKGHSGPPKTEKGLSIQEIQHWAHDHVGRIWSVVVVVLSVLSAILFFPNLSLILFGLGLIVGLLQPAQVEGLLQKAMNFMDGLTGTGRLASWIVCGVIAIVLPFLFTLLVGLSGGVHQERGLHIFEIISRKKNNPR